MESRPDRFRQNVKDSERLLNSVSPNSRRPPRLQTSASGGEFRAIRREPQIVSKDKQSLRDTGIYRIFTGDGTRASTLRALEKEVQKYDAMLARAASGESAPQLIQRQRVAELSPEVWKFVLSIMANVLTTDEELAETAAFLTRECVK